MKSFDRYTIKMACDTIEQFQYYVDNGMIDYFDNKDKVLEEIKKLECGGRYPELKFDLVEIIFKVQE